MTTREEIIRMARESGFAHSWSDAAGLALERFATMVAVHLRTHMAPPPVVIHNADIATAVDIAVRTEREACAKMFDDHLLTTHGLMSDYGYRMAVKHCADAIRARSNE